MVLTKTPSLTDTLREIQRTLSALGRLVRSGDRVFFTVTKVSLPVGTTVGAGFRQWMLLRTRVGLVPRLSVGRRVLLFSRLRSSLTQFPVRFKTWVVPHGLVQRTRRVDRVVDTDVESLESVTRLTFDGSFLQVIIETGRRVWLVRFL